jgi:hypothetical protein
MAAFFCVNCGIFYCDDCFVKIQRDDKRPGKGSYWTKKL